MSIALATRLREGTQEAHSAAESTSFVKSFVKGLIGRDLYSKHLSDLYFVYSAMEEELGKLRDHSILRFIHFPELERKASIEEDLRFYYGPDWKEESKISQAGERYVKRIREIARERPELLVAHSYTRYLGDLSGGQILKGIARKNMGLENGEGTRFYEFDGIRDAGSFKKKYREALDGLPIDERQAQDIIEEANTVFRLNMELFQELEGQLANKASSSC